jgi:hypothetical protein
MWRLNHDCQVCDASFRGGPNAMYCCEECRKKANRSETSCEYCGDVWESTKYKPRKYCSKECRLKATDRWRSPCKICGEHYTGGGPIVCGEKCAWEFNKVKGRRIPPSPSSCDFCGDEYLYRRSEYCSKKCRLRDNRPAPKTCEQCGEEYRSTNKRFCSHKCYGVYQRKQHTDKRKRAEAVGEEIREQTPEMLAEQSGLCVYCGRDITDEFHIDHKTPIARGGEHSKENTHLTCPSCNQEKRALTHEEYIEYRKRVGKHIHDPSITDSTLCVGRGDQLRLTTTPGINC